MYEPRETERHGIKFVSKIELDYDPDLSWLGNYSTDSKNAIDRRTGEVHDEFGCVVKETDDGGVIDRNACEYFTLSFNHWPHNPKNWDHVSPEDKKKQMEKYGVDNLEDVDLQHALEDYRKMEEYENQQWWMVGITTTGYLDGEEIGESSLWGISSEDEAYWDETIRDHIAEIISEVSDKVKSTEKHLEKLKKLQNEMREL